MDQKKKEGLNRALTPLKLWAIIVGAVASGRHFGWNYAFAETNFAGALIAAGIVTLFYIPGKCSKTPFLGYKIRSAKDARSPERPHF